MSSSFPSSYEEQLQAAKQFIEANDQILVVSHLNPDGDAISSTLAMSCLLRRLGKTYVTANEGPIPDKFAFLPECGSIVDLSPTSSHPARFDKAIAVDCADRERIGKAQQLFAANCSLLNIDHHVTNTRFGEVNVVRSHAAATVEMIYELARYCSVPIDLDMANCVYTGLLTDTGGFRYANTTPQVMRIAAELLDLGVQGSALAQQTLETMSPAQIGLLQRALASLAFSTDKKIAWIAVTAQQLAETGAVNEDTDGLVNYARNIEGVDVGLLFKQKSEREVKVSLRSSRRADVSRIAQAFGGGGHARAAGCTIFAELPVAIDQVVREVGTALL
jgi:phosphoesterase RecJ-like protein